MRIFRFAFGHNIDGLLLISARRRPSSSAIARALGRIGTWSSRARNAVIDSDDDESIPYDEGSEHSEDDE